VYYTCSCEDSCVVNSLYNSVRSVRHPWFKEVKLEETESSHTLGGTGEGRVEGRDNGIGCTL
jgi:hypothetical protein